MNGIAPDLAAFRWDHFRVNNVGSAFLCIADSIFDDSFGAYFNFGSDYTLQND